jgi:hypothetical protein
MIVESKAIQTTGASKLDARDHVGVGEEERQDNGKGERGMSVAEGGRSRHRPWGVAVWEDIADVFGLQ